jgi:hypothetical protein
MTMVLKPQDILVLLKLVAMGRRPWSYASLAGSLGMSPSQVHSAIKRVLAVQLAVKKEDVIVPNIRNLDEFLVHGLKYVFAPELGKVTRGIPTSYAASPLNKTILAGDEPPPVWPSADGRVRGQAFPPLYKLAPKAILEDNSFYELLALVDAIRGGRAREREIAVKELRKRLDMYV